MKTCKLNNLDLSVKMTGAQPQSLPPGVVLRAANQKTNDCRGQSHHNSQLSGNRLFGTDFLTEEECGRQSEMQYNASDLCAGWTQDATQEYVFTFPIIVSCRPHSSPDPFGATLPPGEGIGCVSDRYLCNLTWFFKQVHVF